MKKRTKIIGAVVGAVLAISLVGVVAVSADTGTYGPRGGMGMSAGGRMGGMPGGRMGGMPGGRMPGGRIGGMPGGGGVAEALGLTQEEFRDAIQEGQTLTDLAQEAGMTLQELWDAVRAGSEQARLDDIAERVEAGEITQEQADWIIEGLENDFRFGLMDVMPGRPDETHQDDCAEALGMTAEELRLELWGGATLQELFEEAGLDWEAFLEEQQAEHEQDTRDAIQAAADEGAISQDQADWLIEGLDNDWLGGAPGFGPAGMPGGPMGRGTFGESRMSPDCAQGEGWDGAPRSRGMRGLGCRTAPETTIDATEL